MLVNHFSISFVINLEHLDVTVDNFYAKAAQYESHYLWIGDKCESHKCLNIVSIIKFNVYCGYTIKN